MTARQLHVLKAFGRAIRRAAVLALALLAPAAFAQVIYGVAGTAPNVFNQIVILNGTTGVASVPGVPNALPAGIAESAAIGVSPINGLVYVVQRNTTNPLIGTWNPATGATAIIGNAGTPAGIGTFIRATFCPDGRFYIAGNGSSGGAGAEIYELDPNTAALVRTIVVTGVPTNGSGDVVCTSSGDMYIAAQSTTAPNPYQLWRLTRAQIALGGTQAANLQGNLSTDPTQAINGLSERGDGLLVASVALNISATYVITTSTAVINTLTTAPGLSMADLSREFPRDVSVSKAASPTVALQGRTITYTVRASNAGPAVAGSVTIADTLNASAFNVGSASWTCSVLSAGSPTVVPTACGAASGTGNVNSYANLSIGGTVQYVITAPLLSSFSGSVTNSVSATLTGTTVDVTPSNNSVTITSTVSPAADLRITKTNVVSTVTSGTTTSYTVTVSNLGPGTAANALVADAPSAGLSCTTVTCVATTGGAACPASLPLGTPIATGSTTFIGPGVTVPSFPANSTLTFTVQCNVTATGL